MANLVVVAVDDGPHSLAAFKRALKMFARDSTQYHIVNVRAEETEFQIDEISGVTFRDYWQEVEAQKKRKSAEVLEKFRALGEQAHIKFSCQELLGDAREQLCNYCTSSKADCLVLGCRGSGFISRLLLGSVSSYCTSHAPCAVLVDRCEADANLDIADATPAAGS